jgi:putative membrane protein
MVLESPDPLSGSVRALLGVGDSPANQEENAMKSRFHILGTGILTGALALGLSACGDDRRAGTDDFDTTADRMTPREYDAHQSTGAAEGPLGSADRAGVTEVNQMDRDWAVKAAQGGMAEVQLGQLAQRKASSDEVKEFGNRMVEDHGAANDRLKAVARENGFDLPSNLDQKHQATINRLENLSGTQFNRAYMQEMVKDHKHDVDHFQTGVNQLQHPDLKAFASSTLPRLREHLDQAQRISGGQRISRNK